MTTEPPLFQTSAMEIAQSVKEGKQTAESIVTYFSDRIQAFDQQLGALLKHFPEKAKEKARQIDQKCKKGDSLGKLAGVPIILKDNMHIRGEPTTCASKMLENTTAHFNATVTRLIEQEDGIILGKANLDEFAMGSSNEYSAFKKAYNPWDLRCTPGGSSGGSAAACAAGLAPLSLGSDTGGSVRQPAAFCGILGFKPTYGRVSRYGLVAFGSSLDQIGPFARTTKDIALMLEVIAHPCPHDSTSVQHPSEPYVDEIETSIQGKTIGVPYELLKEIHRPDIRTKFEEALDTYKSLGCNIQPIDLPMAKYSIPIYYIIATAEASTNLARYDGIRYTYRSPNAENLQEVYEKSREEGFGAEVKQRILLGTYVLSAGFQDAYYRKAQKIRRLLIEEYKQAFATCDIIALPTTPSTAFELGAIQDPVEMYLQDIFTISANMAGIPAISIPAGFDDDNKPIGLQLQGPQLSDARVLRFAHHFERATKHARAFPPEFAKEAPSKKAVSKEMG